MLHPAATPTATVKLFSPVDNLPATLFDMSRTDLDAHIAKARQVVSAHESVARNGDPAAERYYFFIPEVARDMANARYTVAIMFAEIKRRNNTTNGGGNGVPTPLFQTV